jgi:hypothetical protein
LRALQLLKQEKALRGAWPSEPGLLRASMGRLFVLAKN